MAERIRYLTIVTDVLDDTVTGILVTGLAFDREKPLRPDVWYQSATVSMAIESLAEVVAVLQEKMDCAALAAQLQPVPVVLEHIAVELRHIQDCFAMHSLSRQEAVHGRDYSPP